MLIDVRTKQGWPPKDAPAPKGFKVTPFEAYHIAGKSGRLSWKHAWFCYRDNKYYYIVDAFGTFNTANVAYSIGVRVNGSSGVIELRKK